MRHSYDGKPSKALMAAPQPTGDRPPHRIAPRPSPGGGPEHLPQRACSGAEPLLLPVLLWLEPAGESEREASHQTSSEPLKESVLPKANGHPTPGNDHEYQPAQCSIRSPISCSAPPQH